MKNIVCLGFAKCGTTLLDEAFRLSDRVCTPAYEKELKYFLPRNFPAAAQYDAYMSRFGSSESALYSFEASPPYIHQALPVLAQVLENIKSTLRERHVVVCVRHPVARAYSHYIHDLHSFGLFGNGVFNRRKDLLRRGAPGRFYDALKGARLSLRYAAALRLVKEFFDKDEISLFFLEHDAPRLHAWIGQVTDADVAAEIGRRMPTARKVFGRRPVPNYEVRGDSLIAFGSGPGEVVCYPDADPAQVADVLAARERWTLELRADRIQELMGECFEEDMEQCADITGDTRFMDYIRWPVKAQSAEIQSAIPNSQLMAGDQEQ